MCICGSIGFVWFIEIAPIRGDPCLIQGAHGQEAYAAATHSLRAHLT